jgi:hypothetical protein
MSGEVDDRETERPLLAIKGTRFSTPKFREKYAG